MKHIHESIIGRRGISMQQIWPNPYGLTEKDAIEKIKGWPLEIITLALYETIKSKESQTIKNLQENGIFGTFAWISSCDGWKFWNEIYNHRFDIFYKTYTPEKLKERIENQPR